MALLTVSEYILIISLVITIAFHIIFIRIGRKERRFQRFNDITQRILDVGVTLKDYKTKHYPLWDNAVLNQTEYISYLVNRNKVDFELLSGFLDDALIEYYQKILESPEHEEELKDDNKYREFKTLYQRLIKNKKQ